MHTQILVRHEGNTPRERSTCGWRDRLISREDQALGPAAWAHAVDIHGARPHYHKRSTELYYVLEGDGVVLLDGEEHPVRKGSLVHIPPGVVHGARGRMRVLGDRSPERRARRRLRGAVDQQQLHDVGHHGHDLERRR